MFLGFAFATAGIVVWFVDQNLVNALCNGSLVNLAACHQVTAEANLTLVLAVIAAAAALVALVVLRRS